MKGRLIYIPLMPDEQEAVARLAQIEKRSPRDQAAFIIRQQLEHLGFLQPVPTIPQKESARERQPI